MLAAWHVEAVSLNMSEGAFFLVELMNDPASALQITVITSTLFSDRVIWVNARFEAIRIILRFTIHEKPLIRISI